MSKHSYRQKKSKYKHLGRAGSEEHITAVVQVVRRSQIDELERTINSLTNSLLDLYYDGESEIIPDKLDWLVPKFLTPRFDIKAC